MYGYIYETTNLINGRKYIGKHKAKKFDNSYLGSGKILKEAFDRYGRENFICKILDPINVNTICETLEELNNAEKYYIAYYNCVESPIYYNISEGGDGGHLANMTWWTNGETDLFIKDGDEIPLDFYKGRSDMTEFNKTHIHHLFGEKNGMFGRKGELSPSFGKHPSKETRQKMSDSWNYDKHVTDKSRAKHRKSAEKQKENKVGMFSKESREKSIQTKMIRGTNRLSESTRLKISQHAHNKVVMCIETGKIYKSTMQAEKETGNYHSEISRACKDVNKYTYSKFDTNPIDKRIKYHWKYV